MTTTYHLREKTTGLYYHSSNYKKSYYRPQNVISLKSGNDDILHVAEKGWGKSFKDIGKIKVHINYSLGIMMPPDDIIEKTDRMYCLSKGKERDDLEKEIDAWHAIHPGYQNIPEFLQNYNPLKFFPRELECVEVVDKKKKIINIIDFDPYQYGEDAKKLRVLTDKYGSAVKQVYKKAEQKGLSEFSNVITIFPKFLDNNNYWDFYDSMKPDTPQIDSILKEIGVKRSDIIRTTADFSTAIAFKDINCAMHFRLAYRENNKYTIGFLDIENLIEKSVD